MQFTLSRGSSARLDDGRLGILFRDVTQDSRCPEDVDCVWAGDAAVAVSVTISDRASEYELHSSSQFATSVTVDGYRIQLVTLTPGRRSTGSIEPGAYRAELLATRI